MTTLIVAAKIPENTRTCFISEDERDEAVVNLRVEVVRSAAAAAAGIDWISEYGNLLMMIGTFRYLAFPSRGRR